MSNFYFTLYEVFGYVFPGGVAFLALVILYWVLFVPCVPLGIATFQPGLVTWVSMIAASYLLGHASQGVANKIFRTTEKSVLDPISGSAPAWLRKSAEEAAREILEVGSSELEPRWVFRSLDEYALQTGKDGDREIFVYREGFYRGTALSLFLLSAMLVARTFRPGASIQFTKGPFNVSNWELFTTAAFIGAIGYLFVGRFQRFAEYRITRAVLSGLVMRGKSSAESIPPSSSNPAQAAEEARKIE